MGVHRRCGYCHRRDPKCPRGLCSTCYKKTEIRCLFEPIPKQREKKRKPPKKATTAPPGSEEKIAVMEARLKRGEWIFHEFDVVER